MKTKIGAPAAFGSLCLWVFAQNGGAGGLGNDLPNSGADNNHPGSMMPGVTNHPGYGLPENANRFNENGSGVYTNGNNNFGPGSGGTTKRYGSNTNN